MYDLGPEFGNASVDPGTNLLVSGPPLSGVRRLSLEALAHGGRTDDAVLVITTRYSAQQVLADLETLVDTDNLVLGVVDCVTRRQNRAYEDDRRVKYVTSPAALTRIGIKFSEFIKELRVRDIERTRVVLDSLSTMLPYANTESAFKFVHVLAGQIDDADALGLHVFEPAAHDEEKQRTLAELFDGRVTVTGNAVDEIDL
jgi:hypothetical protein